jgi:transcriptional regulator GlxA family with amidase domain
VAGEAEWAGLGRNDLLSLAVSTISGAMGIEWRHHGIRRPRALELALSAMRRATSEEHLNVPILCRMAGVSERTLYTAFVERYTVSPARFMKAYRLNRLRQDLAQMESQHLSITEIANNLGFRHLGQLARDYRAWFGELPSATHQQREQADRAETLVNLGTIPDASDFHAAGKG